MPVTENPQIASGEAVEKAFDPYLYYAEMPLSGMYYPLGFPVRVTTNSAAVLEAAEESWGYCKPQFDIPTLRVNIGVLEDGSTECPPEPASRAQGHLMVRIADAGNFYVVDLLQGFSFGWIGTATAANRSYLRYHFLESAALSHIANRYSAPVHAACVDYKGSGVLLCGDSGAGKSSLAFACARAGWTYVTDDASFLLHDRHDRQVLGNCEMIRVRPAAATLFPEVADRPITPRAVGKPSIEMMTSTLPGITCAPTSQVEHIVFLNRSGAGPEELVPYSQEATRIYMQKHLCGMEELRAQQMASVERLLTARISEIRYRDMDWAMDRLERLVREQG